VHLSNRQFILIVLLIFQVGYPALL